MHTPTEIDRLENFWIKYDSKIGKCGHFCLLFHPYSLLADAYFLEHMLLENRCDAMPHKYLDWIMQSQNITVFDTVEPFSEDYSSTSDTDTDYTDVIYIANHMDIATTQIPLCCMSKADKINAIIEFLTHNGDVLCCRCTRCM